MKNVSRSLFCSIRVLRSAFLLAMVVWLVGCVGVPDGVSPVAGFERDKYLGKWYEIARLDNRFEKGMSNVTASYSLNEDGSVKVLNKGYIDADKAWKDANGNAVFVAQEDIGYLKVSFFGPFYSSYVVFDLADDYSHSFVTSRDKDYLWLLSRTPTIDEDLKQRFIKTVKSLGYAYQDILFIDQSKNMTQ